MAGCYKALAAHVDIANIQKYEQHQKTTHKNLEKKQ